MGNTLIISNWDQLVRAKSEEYDNLRILVTHYNSLELTGIKVSIVDYNTNDIYFSAFSVNTAGTLIPRGAQLSTEDMITAINSFGFQVAISQPIELTQNVITILQGLYNSGYRYIYKDYPREYNKCMNKSGRPYLIWASKLMESRVDGTLITNIPDFVGDEWDWVEPFTTYPIVDLIEGKASSANMISMAQGNSFLIDITPIDSDLGQPIRLEDGDYVLFTVKDATNNIVLQKVLTNANYSSPEDTSLNCIMEPEDTRQLPVGVYKYDCLLVTIDGSAVTFISSVFKIEEAIGQI